MKKLLLLLVVSLAGCASWQTKEICTPKEPITINRPMVLPSYLTSSCVHPPALKHGETVEQLGEDYATTSILLNSCADQVDKIKAAEDDFISKFPPTQP